ITFDGSARATSGQPQLAVIMANNDPAVLNVNGTNLDLFIELRTGPMTGNIFVSSLHLGYQLPGTRGIVDLFGTINGLSGRDAAAASFIQPWLHSNYMINGCPIQSFNCVQITTLQPPVTNPLKDVQAGRLRSISEYTTILPDVAERDY
ncbi:MAG: hypothetical protein AB7S57_19430, partial [Acetobacteraceae bacterium]